MISGLFCLPARGQARSRISGEDADLRARQAECPRASYMVASMFFGELQQRGIDASIGAASSEHGARYGDDEQCPYEPLT